MLEGIRYIFQIPMAWFRAVDKFITGLYAGSGIRFAPGNLGIPCIELDFAVLDERYAGGGGDLSGVGANKIVGTNANSEATAAADMPTQNANNVQVLGVAKNATVLSWLTASLVPEDTSSKTNLANAAPGTATANSTTWTYGGTNGATLRVQTRTKWDGTYLYGFYRDVTIDRFGRAYAISAETRFTIDTPVAYTGS